jgi:two-component system LytT family response regulator
LKNAKTKDKDYFFINASHKLHKIFYDDILYLEGLKDYTKIHLASATSPLIVLHNLKYFEDLLEQTEFIRIHRSYIVSIRKIMTISRKSVTMHSHELPVSDNYRESFFSIVEKHAK